MMMFLKVLFFVSFSLSFSIAEYFSSTDKLRDLVALEGETISYFESLAKTANEKVSKFLQEKLSPWKDEHVAALADIEEYIGSPLNAFHIIKRNSFGIESILKGLAELNQKTDNFPAESLIEKSEVSGAVGSMLRSQGYYDCKSEDFVEGVILGIKTREPFSLHDIYVLANESYYQPGNEYFSKTYFEILNEKLKTASDSDVDEIEVAERLAELTALNPINSYNIPIDYNKIQYYEMQHLLTVQSCRESVLQRGVFRRSHKTLKNLHCRYMSHGPFNLIGPFKIEELSFEPLILIYHDIVAEDEIEQLKQKSREKKQPATVGIYARVKDYSRRVSQVAWIEDDENVDLFQRLNQRFEDMTGLSYKYAESIQVQNYGVGGHYFFHWDADETRLDEVSPGRITTLVIWLSDVKYGGATAFPYAKMAAKPKKGSAVLWYNMGHSGHTDWMTLHAGCPVLLGSKWVAVKLNWNADQQFKRLCKPEKFEYMEPTDKIYETFIAQNTD